MTRPDCYGAAQNYYQDENGRTFEVFWLNGDYVFENQVRDPSSLTRTHPGWVLESGGYCQWNTTPPPKNGGETSTAPPPPPSVNAASVARYSGDTSGALLLVLGLIASAGYALYQWKNGRADFDGDYHPMSDAPAIPTVYTDLNLDILHERFAYPQYQGISEPNPWQSAQDAAADAAASRNQPSPVTEGDTAVTGNENVTGDEGGDAALARNRERFESEVLPAPKGGYFLAEESLMSRGQAYQIVRAALILGYSKNWLCEYVFKIPKGGNGAKYKILSALVERVKGELNG